jgi:quinoprotein glucose dehydrogenase
LGGGSGPPLTGVGGRLNADAIKGIVSGGKGFMPAFASLSALDLESLSTYLGNPAAAGGRGGRGQGEAGPVNWSVAPVESGPAAPARTAAPVIPGESRALYGGNGGILPYPEGVDVPQDRYNSGYGNGGNAFKPPFSTLTAYDLNKGTIKWQVPAGDDPVLAAQGIRGTGARGLRVGIVSTAGGVVFIAGGDNKLHAYDDDNGKEIWTHDIAGGSSGSPAMYEIDGRQYLVLTVNPPGAAGRGGQAAGAVDPKYAGLPSGYVVFAMK